MIRIGIDLDGTLGNLVVPWLERINCAHGTNFVSSDWEAWDGMNFPEPIQKVLPNFYTPDIYEDVEPYYGAQEAVEKWHDEGFSLVCITANLPDRRSEFEAEKVKWIKRHFPMLDGKILFQDDKSNAPVDILIDDKPENLMSGAFIPVVFHQSWNKSFECAFRIHSWDRATSIIVDAVEQVSSSKKIYVS